MATASENLHSIARWIGRTGTSAGLDPAQPVLGAHCATWHDALLRIASQVDVTERMNAYRFGDRVPMLGIDRIDSAYAESILRHSIEALARLATTAHANGGDIVSKAIQQDVATIADGLEALVLGVARPINTTDKGVN